jgi:hypothetical protein
MSSALLKIAEEYLVMHSLKHNKFLKDQRIANEYHNRKLPEFLIKKLDEMEKETERKGLSPH